MKGFPIVFPYISHGFPIHQALIRCAHACHEARHAARFGVTGVESEVSCDWQQVKQHIKRLGSLVPVLFMHITIIVIVFIIIIIVITHDGSVCMVD